MFESLFDLSSIVAGVAITGLLSIFGLAGRALFSRYVLPRLKLGADESVLTGNIMQAVLVFYGLAVALIAVSVWQSYTDAGRTVTEEATAIGILYHDVSSYPEPLRSQLRQDLREYLHYIIHQAWPLQRRGEVPNGGEELIGAFQDKLGSLEPTNEGQKALHGETFRAYDHMVETRRMRLDAVRTGLPGVLWFVVVIGALLSLTFTFFFRVDDVLLHKIEIVLLAVLVGLIIFIIFALDHPFRGDLALGSDPYQLIYDQVMKP